MRILFENYAYNKKSIENIVPEWMLRIGTNADSVNLPYVGYLWSHTAGDVVFFLPNIFIDDSGMAFCSILPEQLLSSADYKSLNNSALSKRLYSLSLWIYESIRVYRDNSKDYEVSRPPGMRRRNWTGWLLSGTVLPLSGRPSVP